MTMSSRLAKFITRWGHSPAAHKALGRSPVHAWSQQRNNARQRGIPWALNLAEWWNVWQESGKWEARGRGHAHYVMSRVGDCGAYTLGNVFIQLADQNTREGRGKHCILPMGVKATRFGRFMAYKDGYYLGTYQTCEGAQRAYKLGRRLINAIRYGDAQRFRWARGREPRRATESDSTPCSGVHW